MYPVNEPKIVEKCLLASERVHKEEEVPRHMTASSKALFTKNRKHDTHMLDLLKRTRLDAVTLVSQPTGAVVNRPLKRHKQDSRQQPQPIRRSSVSQRASMSTKKIATQVNPTTKVPPIRQRNTIRNSEQSSVKTNTESSTSVSVRSHPITRTNDSQRNVVNIKEPDAFKIPTNVSSENHEMR